MSEFQLPFPPVGANQKKGFRKRQYIALVREVLAGPHLPLKCDVTLRAVFNPPETSGFVRYDLDNLLKPTQDALKGIAYIDDNQVRCLRAQFGHRAGSGSVCVSVSPIVRKRKIMNQPSIFSEGEKTR